MLQCLFETLDSRICATLCTDQIPLKLYTGVPWHLF